MAWVGHWLPQRLPCRKQTCTFQHFLTLATWFAVLTPCKCCQNRLQDKALCRLWSPSTCQEKRLLCITLNWRTKGCSWCVWCSLACLPSWSAELKQHCDYHFVECGVTQQMSNKQERMRTADRNAIEKKSFVMFLLVILIHSNLFYLFTTFFFTSWVVLVQQKSSNQSNNNFIAPDRFYLVTVPFI